MNNLLCNVTTCVYNSENLCSKESIKIAGKNTITANFTSCEDFRRKTGELSSISSISSKSANTMLDVTCEAINCEHNKDNKCDASNITIGGEYALSEVQTECSTFVSRIDK